MMPYWQCFALWDSVWAASKYGPVASLKCSELLAPNLKVAYNGVIIVLQGFRIWGPGQGTIGFALEAWDMLAFCIP